MRIVLLTFNVHFSYSLYMPRFADQMAALEDSIRARRRPLPTRDLAGNHRPWAAAVLQAEIAHATDDFWRCVYAEGAGLLFDRYQRDREAGPFRFEHEVKARIAWAALGDLNMHDGDARGPWACWDLWDRARKRQWARERLERKRRFWSDLAAYRAARAALSAVLPKAA
jgi:hypothetical protein